MTPEIAKSLSVEALNKLPPDQKEAALASLPLFQKLHKLAASGGLLSTTSLFKLIHDFIVATIDTPEERAHVEGQVQLAMDKYIAPKLGGVDSTLYKEVATLVIDLTDRLLKTVAGDTQPLTTNTVAHAKSSFGLA